jgi:hypothetical protein
MNCAITAYMRIKWRRRVVALLALVGEVKGIGNM